MYNTIQYAIILFIFRLFFIVFLLGSVSSSPVRREARSNLVLLGAREGNQRAQPRQDTQQLDLPAGEALDIFYRYGGWSYAFCCATSRFMFKKRENNAFTPNGAHILILTSTPGYLNTVLFIQNISCIYTCTNYFLVFIDNLHIPDIQHLWRIQMP